MTYHFSPVKFSIDLILIDLGIRSAYSEMDRVRLVEVVCGRCGERFDELLQTAIEDVVLALGHLCIACDGMAEDTAEVAIVDRPRK